MYVIRWMWLVRLLLTCLPPAVGAAGGLHVSREHDARPTGGTRKIPISVGMGASGIIAGRKTGYRSRPVGDAEATSDYLAAHPLADR